MAKYIVKTFDNRSLVIEADELAVHTNGSYLLTKKRESGQPPTVVAYVDNHILAIAEESAVKSDFTETKTFPDDDFFNHVWSIIDCWHDDDDQEGVDASDGETIQ